MWTLQASTDRALEWLRRVTGSDGREIEVEPVEARELCNRARTEGLTINSQF
jgi:hypothetical protein